MQPRVLLIESRADMASPPAISGLPPAAPPTTNGTDYGSRLVLAAEAELALLALCIASICCAVISPPLIIVYRRWRRERRQRAEVEMVFGGGRPTHRL